MSVDGQEILALHELGYRFADSIEGLSCLQVQVLFEALRCRNERIRESLETQSHLAFLGVWNSEIFAAITGLVGTVTGIIIGAKK